MQQVPTVVRGDDGIRASHGVVERVYDKCRAILQAYVRDKQEDRLYVYMYYMYMHMQVRASHNHIYRLHEEVKYGDA